MCEYKGGRANALPSKPSVSWYCIKLFYLIFFYHSCALNLPNILCLNLDIFNSYLSLLVSYLSFLLLDVNSFFNMFCLYSMDCFRFIFLHLRAYIILLQVGHIPYFLFHISCKHLGDSFKSSFLHEKIFHTFHYFWKGLDKCMYELTPWPHSIFQQNLSSPLPAYEN